MLGLLFSNILVNMNMTNIVTVAVAIDDAESDSAFDNLRLFQGLDDVFLGVAVSTVMRVGVLMSVLALLVDHAVGAHA